jgi:SLOG cluster2
MSYQEPLSKHAVAISISESSDMAVLGLAEEHLNDAMAEVARYLLVMGARLIYGGDLRPGGFTEVLFELVARHRRDADAGDERVGVSNYLPWPVHISLPPEEVRRLSESLSGVAELIYLTEDGRIIPPDERQLLEPRQPADDEWARGLTTMRNVVTGVSDARVVLGGRVEGFKGRMPGVAEEALAALSARQPLFLLGGFGGCARDIACDLGLAADTPRSRASWAGRSVFAGFNAGSLNNGLDAEENAILATTVHVDQAVTLILRGLLRIKGGTVRPDAGGK